MTFTTLEATNSPGARRVVAGLYLSAGRCLLLYVALPLFGLTGRNARLIAPLDLVLHGVAVACVVTGCRSLWRARSRWRVPYTALALAVGLMSSTSIASTLDGLVR